MVNNKYQKKMGYAIQKKLKNGKYVKVHDGVEMRFSVRKMYNIHKNSMVLNSEVVKFVNENKEMLDDYADVIITVKNDGMVHYRYDGDENE